MVVTPDKVAVEGPTGFLDSEPAFRLLRWVGAETWAGLVATVFPEFIARDGQERANGCGQGNKRRVGAARSAARTRPGAP
ncbi:Uncharacterized protein KF715C_ch55730 [Pseudomonas putida]|uniref:Uncharacterized protein n=2 Tax=Pseudomonas TaxID=286 RepID=A0A1L7NKY9_PSEPU|nr:hypothetical protein K814_0102510 [Pseudomonas fluorescens LMG 5329]BAW26146.1 Uncharacterized protein KF715C_ch55730 [Pseudomonas putida]